MYIGFLYIFTAVFFYSPWCNNSAMFWQTIHKTQYFPLSKVSKWIEETNSFYFKQTQVIMVKYVSGYNWTKVNMVLHSMFNIPKIF